ncbi:unnamed protein product [marine sediment metagenome]|uniref:Uncharacterized protein n=1 Tax=marine sediment metagenome TaxID=412755 RepID=X0WHT2_9ZZZZ
MSIIDASTRTGSNPINLGTLTTGSTNVVNVTDSKDLMITITMAGTPDDVFAVEGSMNNVSWANLAADGTNTTIDSAKTEIFVFDGSLPPYVRIRKVSGVNPATVYLYLGRIS